ncbi:hypothetical protein [Meiothermus rufus]|uniref:hypothetical protein n=1 Tax=Meiothermus rufus TaxID=604332 RepID=UPI0012EBD68B|nr:hypothetical protein [Meiothermus rufus]
MASRKRPRGAGTKPTKRGSRWTMQVTLGRRPDGKLDRRRVFRLTPKQRGEALLKGLEVLGLLKGVQDGQEANR